MSKPLPRRIPSDDCEIVEGEAVYRPHEGEWVELFAGMRVGDFAMLADLNQLDVRLAAVEGEDDETAKRIALNSDAMGQLKRMLAVRLVAWNWTDDSGHPMPQPTESGAIDRLRLEELTYLATIMRGETPAEKKAGTNGSRTTSTATPPRPTRKR